MALADLPLEHCVLQRLRRGEGAKHVGDLRARLPHPFSDLLLREVVRLHKELVSARGLDRVEVGALEILHERELETVTHVVPNDGRDGRLARDARRQHATVAGHELVGVALPRNHYWLQHAVPGYRCRELGDAVGVEIGARLLRIGADPLERDVRRSDRLEGRR